MGILTSALLCGSHGDRSQTTPHRHHLHLHSESQSLSSQPSLPSVPSLSSQNHSAARHRCVATLQTHSHVFSLSLAGDSLLISGSSDRGIRLWPLPLPPPPHALDAGDHLVDNHDNVVGVDHGAVKSLAVFGDKLFSAHQDHKIRVWRIGARDGRAKYIAAMPTVADRARRLFSAANRGGRRRHGNPARDRHLDAVSGVALSPDGSGRLYSVSWDRSIRIWRAASGFRCLESVGDAHDDAINAVAVSREGFVYTGSADRKIRVWRRGPGEKRHSPVATLEKHRSAVNALALSDDGSLLYSGACDRSVVVWERGGGAHMWVVGALRGHAKAILCLAVAGDVVCSGSADGTVRVWRRGVDGRSHCCVGVMEGHGGPVKCVTAAVDEGESGSAFEASYVVYSGSLDGGIKVWRVWVPTHPLLALKTI